MVGFFEGVGVKLTGDLIAKVSGSLIIKASGRREARIEAWVERGVDAFEENGSIPDNGAVEDLDDEIEAIGLEIEKFVQRNLVSQIFDRELMWIVADRMQSGTRHLGPRLAGDFLNYAWHGIGGWVA